MMSQDELQAKVVNIEDHVFKITSRQVVLYAWGLAVGVFALTGIYFGFKYALDKMQTSFTYEIKDMRKDFKNDMKDMEYRMITRIDSQANKSNAIKAMKPEVIIRHEPSRALSPRLYYQRVVNGEAIFIPVSK